MSLSCAAGVSSYGFLCGPSLHAKTNVIAEQRTLREPLRQSREFEKAMAAGYASSATTVVAQLPDAKRHFSMVHVSAPLAETFALHSNGRALESAK